MLFTNLSLIFLLTRVSTLALPIANDGTDLPDCGDDDLGMEDGTAFYDEGRSPQHVDLRAGELVKALYGAFDTQEAFFVPASTPELYGTRCVTLAPGWCLRKCPSHSLSVAECGQVAEEADKVGCEDTENEVCCPIGSPEDCSKSE